MDARFVSAVLIAAAVAFCGIEPAHGDGAREAGQTLAVPAPEFTHDEPAAWINSAPLTLAAMRGRVVLIDFWTFDCWNCYRSFPWLNDLERRLAGRALTIIGVHSPESDRERGRDRVVSKVAEFELAHPVMLDDDFQYWRAMNNRYWPAFYLIDKAGLVRGMYVGETHIGDAQAREIEARIEALLAE